MQQLIDFITAIIRDLTLLDFLDLTVVAVAVYLALTLIEGSRAYNLIKGLGIILLVTVIATNIKLNTVGWILTGILPTGFVAMVIIFQPEIRRLLEDIGKGRLFSEHRFSDDSVDDLTEEICKTVESCSKKRIGALIVFEQAIGLRDFINNGVRLQSKISSELMTTIFLPFTPLHDGAIIIRGKTLEAAGCFLPTASNHNEIAKELGSRHRAAVGVTEITDALVIVVSEETGAISKGRTGKLTRNLTMDDVRKHIKEALQYSEKHFKGTNK
ncbi:MAG: TIGR00159 family protein [Candidatus Riflebacteria bacterium]|nr:TIGR00159 family protein [Candidatus Riflebacteria bacterium]